MKQTFSEEIDELVTIRVDIPLKTYYPSNKKLVPIEQCLNQNIKLTNRQNSYNAWPLEETPYPIAGTWQLTYEQATNYEEIEVLVNHHVVAKMKPGDSFSTVFEQATSLQVRLEGCLDTIAIVESCLQLKEKFKQRHDRLCNVHCEVTKSEIAVETVPLFCGEGEEQKIIDVLLSGEGLIKGEWKDKPFKKKFTFHDYLSLTELVPKDAHVVAYPTCVACRVYEKVEAKSVTVFITFGLTIEQWQKRDIQDKKRLF